MFTENIQNKLMSTATSLRASIFPSNNTQFRRSVAEESFSQDAFKASPSTKSLASRIALANMEAVLSASNSVGNPDVSKLSINYRFNLSRGSRLSTNLIAESCFGFMQRFNGLEQ